CDEILGPIGGGGHGEGLGSVPPARDPGGGKLQRQGEQLGHSPLLFVLLLGGVGKDLQRDLPLRGHERGVPPHLGAARGGGEDVRDLLAGEVAEIFRLEFTRGGSGGGCGGLFRGRGEHL